MADKFDEWAVVELMGRVRRAGRLTEQVIAGHGFLRLEIPNGDKWVTQLVSPTAVYAITPTTEAMAREAAAMWHPQPVSRWELEPAKPSARDSYDSDGEPPW